LEAARQRSPTGEGKVPVICENRYYEAAKDDPPSPQRLWRTDESSYMLPPVAAVLPAEKGNETLVK
jgi:hypothetical protein